MLSSGLVRMSDDLVGFRSVQFVFLVGTLKLLKLSCVFGSFVDISAGFVVSQPVYCAIRPVQFMFLTD